MRRTTIAISLMLLFLLAVTATATEVSLGVFPTGESIGCKYFDGVLFNPMDIGEVAKITSVKLVQDERVVSSWQKGEDTRYIRLINFGTFGLPLSDVWLSIYFQDLRDVEVILGYELKPGMKEAEFWYIASNLIKDEVTIWLTRTGAKPAKQVVFAKLAPGENQAKDKVVQIRSQRQAKLTTTWGKIKYR